MQINKIFHIADVHVRNFKRHSEYRAVFKNLFKYIKEHSDDKSLIYLAGDIVHSKNDMSPELVQLVAEFFTQCANIAPTIIITGNHDTNLNNDSRLDALTPIINAINHPNIKYWKDSGVYEFGGIAFSVFSVYGPTSDWVLSDSINSDYKIALHHGAVNTAITDLEHEIQNEFVTPKIFEGFDLALLGDIHKRQFLDSNKSVAYAGSLIQQNHGEDLDHGILVWDLPSRSAEYVPIKNSIGYATIEMHDGKIITPKEYFDTLPKNINLRIKYSNTNYKDVTKVIQYVKTKHKLLETTVIKVNDYEYINNNSNTVLGDVRDVEYQNELLTQFIKNTENSNSIDIDGVRHVNRIINSKLDTSNVVVRNVIWKPVKFEFSNMFSYGPNNVVDFSNFVGIQGLFAPNASGKSTLLDAITFCLFDKCSRTYRAKDVMNNKKQKFDCKLTFELNHETFVIERFGTQDKRTGNVKVDVNFGKIINGQYESLNDKDRDKTNRVIRGYIGSYDDFLLTALSTQNDNKNFIFKTQRERKDLLNSFLDISIFDELYVIAKNEIKGKQAIIKNLEMEVSDTSYLKLPEQIEQVNTRFLQVSGSYISSEHVLHDLETSIKNLSNKIITVDETIDIEEIKLELETNNQTISRIQDSIKQYKSVISDTKNQISQSKQDFEKINYDDIIRDKETLAQIYNQLQKYKEQYVRISANVKHYQDQISHLDDHEYDPNCQYCVNNPFVQKAYEAKDLLPESLIKQSEIKQNIQTITQKYDKLKPEIETRESDYNTLKNTIYRLEDSLTNLQEIYDNNIELLKNTESRIKQLKQQEQKYYDQKQIQDSNRQILSEIQELEIQQYQVKGEYKMLHSSLMEYNTQLSSLNTKFSVWKDKHRQLNELYDEILNFENYLSVIAKGGVPHMLLKKILPVIEDEVNSILNQIVEFYVTLDADDKNINCYLHYNDDTHWPVELASGMERFMISVAMRAALINVSSLPRPNFIAIDEGFGVADSEHIAKFALLFVYLRSQFDLILCVTHIDTLKDSVDGTIEISKGPDGYSKINAR